MADIEDRSTIADMVTATTKRKSYVIAAFSRAFAEKYNFIIEEFFSTYDKKIKYLRVFDKKSLLQSFNRNVDIFLIDDDFVGLEFSVKFAYSLKSKKNNMNSSIIFFTNSPHNLIKHYGNIVSSELSKVKFIYQSNLKAPKIISEIKSILLDLDAKVDRRLTKRFKYEQPIRVIEVGSNKKFKGNLLDISRQSAVFIIEGDHIFRYGEQLEVILPIIDDRMIKYDYQEFIKIPGRVYRISLEGRKIVMVWTELSESQNLLLSELLVQLK